MATARRAGRHRHKAHADARRANREVKEATGNPWLKLAMRFGYVIRGLLYCLMGLLALALAAGHGSYPADQRGAVALLIGNPFAKLVLVVLGLGLVAYSLWGFVRAVYDPLRRGDDVPGLAARLGFAWSGFAYASLLLVVLQLLFGGDPHRLGSDSVQSLVARALVTPAGRWATVAAGLVGAAAGLGQFVDAWRAPFRRDFKRAEMHREELETAVWLGRYGMLARGVIFTMTGWFVLVAGVRADASQARGFGAAFAALMQGPYGHLAVAGVGIGFIALALHSLAYARWVRMMPG